MSTETTTPTTTHLASLSAALLAATDRESRARVFAELAEEAVVLADTAPTERLRQCWLDLSEDFNSESRSLLQWPSPKRRWFR